jgi:hypothetical protein
LIPDLKRQRLSSEQIGLVREVVEERAPHLAGTVEELSEGRVIADPEIDELAEVISYTMSEETDEKGRYTERGLALDGLIGILFQWSARYFDR